MKNKLEQNDYGHLAEKLDAFLFSLYKPKVKRSSEFITLLLIHFFESFAILAYEDTKNEDLISDFERRIQISLEYIREYIDIKKGGENE